ncbi:MAG: zf-HC2 domain-containing protein [Holophagaceae bacterium]|uniref:Zf-HC2 domain-containing protein n=1 Tax=Candidatus Geothrix odensensis TaxID=2954440 RepID=A0A936F4F5_9BACT|nr:zf-HC2 domain-containing protein [Candidatus Geothrix odensensis]
MTPHVHPQLPLWVEGDLDAADMAAVDHHLDQCPDCRSAAENLRASQIQLREAMVSPFGASDRERLRRQVMVQVRAEGAAKPVRRLLPRFALLAACAASLLLAVFLWRQGPAAVAPEPTSAPKGHQHPAQPPPALAVRQDPSPPRTRDPPPPHGKPSPRPARPASNSRPPTPPSASSGWPRASPCPTRPHPWRRSHDHHPHPRPRHPAGLGPRCPGAPRHARPADGARPRHLEGHAEQGVCDPAPGSPAAQRTLGPSVSGTRAPRCDWSRRGGSTHHHRAISRRTLPSSRRRIKRLDVPAADPEGHGHGIYPPRALRVEGAVAEWGPAAGTPGRGEAAERHPDLPRLRTGRQLRPTGAGPGPCKKRHLRLGLCPAGRPGER